MFLLLTQGDALVNLDRVNGITIDSEDFHGGPYGILADFGEDHRNYTIAACSTEADARAVIKDIARIVNEPHPGDVIIDMAKITAKILNEGEDRHEL